MKKILFIFVLSASLNLLHADSYGSYSYQGYNSQGSQGYGQSGSGYNQQGSQGYGQYNYGQQNQNPQNNSGYSYDRYSYDNDNDDYNNNGQGQYQGNDQQLAAKIKNVLKNAPSNKYSNVNVSVNNGYVTLSGTVASQEDKQYVEKNVRNMDGVVGIDNQITVKAQNGQNGKKYRQY